MSNLVLVDNDREMLEANVKDRKATITYRCKGEFPDWKVEQTITLTFDQLGAICSAMMKSMGESIDPVCRDCKKIRMVLDHDLDNPAMTLSGICAKCEDKR